MARPILNLDEVTFVDQQHGRAFECRLGLIGRRLGALICDYPDSGKFGAFAGAMPGGPKEARVFSVFGRRTDEVDYWDGEPDDSAPAA